MPDSVTDARRELILQQILRHQHVDVTALSSQLGVSQVTVRRDLEQLESVGLLKRVHGGAQATHRPGQPSLFDARLLQRVAAKRAIGDAAARQVGSGSAVLLDSGTTVLEVARALPRVHPDGAGLTVVTRSLVIAAELRRLRQVRLVVLGGVYLHDFDTFVGPQVEHALEGLHVDTLIVGADGVSVEHGLTTDNVMEAGLYRQMARPANRIVVVADAGKIGADRLQTILGISEIHAFVTNATAPSAFVDELRGRGIQVILAD
jgi:DeoR/GlpR family transcriptional regulator of sugar metabolism